MKITSNVVSFTEETKVEALSYMREILDSGTLTLGKYTKLLEDEVQKIVGSKYIAAANSGTSALEMILRALDVRGKKVLVPTNTFAATVFAVVHAGGIPVFVDTKRLKGYSGVEEYHLKMDSNTKVAIAVHIGGEIDPHLSELVELCRERGVFFVEDSAHALGSHLNHQYAGTFGIAGAFSLYPTKVVTSGEGGLVVTEDEFIYRQILTLRDQGKENFWNNYSVAIGYNWRLSEMNAALGYVHVKTLSEIIEHRNIIANLYRQQLQQIEGIKLSHIQKDNLCNYYKFIVFFEQEVDVETVKAEMKEIYGLSFGGEVYKVPCHLQPAFAEFALGESLPNAENFCKNHLVLPIYNSLTLEEAEYIISSFKTLLEKYSRK